MFFNTGFLPSHPWVAIIHATLLAANLYIKLFHQCSFCKELLNWHYHYKALWWRYEHLSHNYMLSQNEISLIYYQNRHANTRFSFHRAMLIMLINYNLWKYTECISISHLVWMLHEECLYWTTQNWCESGEFKFHYLVPNINHILSV
jgi:hypothetical protein